MTVRFRPSCLFAGDASVADIAEIQAGEADDGCFVIPIMPWGRAITGEAGGPGEVVEASVSNLTARSLGLGADLFADIGPRGWRLHSRSTGRLMSAQRQARDVIARDLDACEQVWSNQAPGFGIRELTVEICGPMTLARNVELSNGESLLTDAGALRDLCQALQVGLQDHLAELRRRFNPEGFRVVVSEPAAADVATGAVRNAATDGYYPAVGAEELAGYWRELTSLGAEADHAASAVDVLFGFGIGRWTDIPLTALQTAGFIGLVLPMLSLQTNKQLDHAASLIDSGLQLELGALPDNARGAKRDEFTGQYVALDERVYATKVARLWDLIGFSREELLDKVRLTSAETMDTLSPQALRNHKQPKQLESSLATQPTTQSAQWLPTMMRGGARTADLLNRAVGDL